jgi:hypothetical protein
MSLKEALAGIKQVQDTAPEVSVQPKPRNPPAKKAVSPATARMTGKSSNPDYEPVKIYVRKRTRRNAERKWEDAEGGDFSELVEQLLVDYLKS